MTSRRRGRAWLLVLAMLVGACVAGVAQNGPGAMRQSNAAEPPARGAEERLPFMPRAREEAKGEAPGVGGLFLRTLGALIFIVGLIAAAAWGLRQMNGAGAGGSAGDAPEMAVLGTVSLGDRRSLSAVRFGERILLIGATAQSITLLASQRRRPAWSAPPMRSVAELLEEDEPPAFDEALARAGERLDRRTRPSRSDQRAHAPGTDPERS
ncbi:MAG: flagellar biosynthetic protein FliO [Blastocatellia bacterium]|nr:flagellar biosynthetic protein FliO [Blastocatellia bacterium]